MERLIVWHRWLPPPESGPEALAHAESARARCHDLLSREGARTLASIGGTLVCSLDPAYIDAVIEACLSLLTTFGQGATPEAGSLSIAIAVGALPGSEGASLISDAVDRAQALANRAHPGELVLDAAAHASTAATFLFARELTVSSGVAGEVVDRAFPRRGECRAGLAQLSPPSLPSSALSPFLSLKQLAQSRGRHRVLVMGPYGAGVNSWLHHLAKETKPVLWLHVSAVAAPLAPLSGLAYALERLRAEQRGPEQLLDPKHEGDARTIDLLAQLREGRPVSRREAISSLRHLIIRVTELHGVRCWISVSPVPLVDPASVGVIADAVRDCPADHLLVLRMALDSKPPEALARGGGLTEIRLPALTQPEARALAQSMLGKAAANDLARRAAAMGGTTPLGVAEAVRVLVSSGDVIHDGKAFRWRRGPAGRINTIAVEEMIEERVDQLDDDARRVLEILASAPDPAEAALIDQVRAADGVSADAQTRALSQLVSESLIERTGRILSLTSVVRSVVTECMPSARLSEVHRFIADAMRTRLGPEHIFAHATLGYYMARGGNPEGAVDVLLDVARSAGQLGFVRSGVRLAAAAVECDPTGQTRERAAQIAQALSVRKEAPKREEAAQTPAEPASDLTLPVPEHPEHLFSSQAMQQAIEAIIARDFDGVERSLELLVAAGKDGPAVDRLRAMTLLAQGERSAAIRTLDRARQRGTPTPLETPRALLARALISLDAGEASAAVRETLRALSITRAQQDPRGEEACLLALSSCYRKLGREREASKLERAARERAGLQAPSASGSPPP